MPRNHRSVRTQATARARINTAGGAPVRKYTWWCMVNSSKEQTPAFWMTRPLISNCGHFLVPVQMFWGSSQSLLHGKQNKLHFKFCPMDRYPFTTDVSETPKFSGLSLWNSLSKYLSFLVCEKEIIVIPMSQSYCGDYRIQYMQSIWNSSCHIANAIELF